jgi:hypothetical protein
MSTIKLEIEVSAENVSAVSQFLQAIAGGDKSKKMEVVEAEEVKAPTPAKAAAPRPSRAKQKPIPVEELEEEIDEELEEEIDEELEEEEGIDADDIRALQATKVDKHREAIKAQLKKLGATGIKDLDEKKYQAYYDFLGKLK